MFSKLTDKLIVNAQVKLLSITPQQYFKWRPHILIFHFFFFFSKSGYLNWLLAISNTLFAISEACVTLVKQCWDKHSTDLRLNDVNNVDY